MAHLCAMKKTTEFTDIQINVWYAILQRFPDWAVNRSVISLGLSSEDFPDVGDMYRLCREQMRKAGLISEPYAPYGTGERSQLTADELDTIGRDLSLVVNRPRQPNK